MKSKQAGKPQHLQFETWKKRSAAQRHRNKKKTYTSCSRSTAKKSHLLEWRLHADILMINCNCFHSTDSAYLFVCLLVLVFFWYCFIFKVNGNWTFHVRMAVTSTESKMMMIDEMAEYMPHVWSTRNHIQLIHFIKWKELLFLITKLNWKRGSCNSNTTTHDRACIKTYGFALFLPLRQQYFDIWICFIRESQIGKAAGQFEWTFYREKWNFSARST